MISAVLRDGESVRVISIQNNYCLVTHKNSIGWINKKYLIAAVKHKKYIVDRSKFDNIGYTLLRIRPDDSKNFVKDSKIYDGETVDVISERDIYYNVKHKGISGWIKKQYVHEKEEEESIAGPAPSIYAPLPLPPPSGFVPSPKFISAPSPKFISAPIPLAAPSSVAHLPIIIRSWNINANDIIDEVKARTQNIYQKGIYLYQEFQKSDLPKLSYSYTKDGYTYQNETANLIYTSIIGHSNTGRIEEPHGCVVSWSPHFMYDSIVLPTYFAQSDKYPADTQQLGRRSTPFVILRDTSDNSLYAVISLHATAGLDLSGKNKPKNKQLMKEIFSNIICAGKQFIVNGKLVDNVIIGGDFNRTPTNFVELEKEVPYPRNCKIQNAPYIVSIFNANLINMSIHTGLNILNNFDERIDYILSTRPFINEHRIETSYEQPPRIGPDPHNPSQQKMISIDHYEIEIELI